MAIDTIDKNDLNNMCPVAQRVGLGTELDAIETKADNADTYGVYTISYAITADATGGLSTTAPFDCTIIDVIVQCTTANASGTVTVSDGTTDITDAIACAVDTTVTHAGTIDDDASSLSSGDTITFTTNGTADRGTVEVIVKKS